MRNRNAKCSFQISVLKLEVNSRTDCEHGHGKQEHVGAMLIASQATVRMTCLAVNALEITDTLILNKTERRHKAVGNHTPEQ